MPLSRDRSDDLLCTKPWSRHVKLSLAGFIIPAMVDHMKGEVRPEAGSRNADLQLTHLR